MLKKSVLLSFASAFVILASCNSSSKETVAPVQPELVFPDMEAPTAFTGAYTLTENETGTLRVFAKEARDSTDLYESAKQDDGSWSVPVRLDWPKNKSNTNPHFSPFDGRLYFASDRELPGAKGRNDMNIWSTEYTDNGWGTATPLPGDVNTGDNETSVTTTADGTMYFVSKHPRGQGGQDIYTATYDDDTKSWKYSALPDNVSSPRVESHVMVTPDGNNIVFYSYRSPKLGVVDLVAASKEEDGSWTDPYILGPLINTPGIDFGAGASADGNTFFFSRERRLMSLPMDVLMTEIEASKKAYLEDKMEARTARHLT